MVCIEASQRCVVILSNDVRSEAGFARLVRFILGDIKHFVRRDFANSGSSGAVAIFPVVRYAGTPAPYVMSVA